MCRIKTTGWICDNNRILQKRPQSNAAAHEHQATKPMPKEYLRQTVLNPSWDDERKVTGLPSYLE